MHPSRALRLLKGAAAATMATFAALHSHVAGGGEVPGWLGIVVPWVLSSVVCTLLASHRLSLLRLTISVLLAQLLFHTLFVLGADSAGAGQAVMSTGHMHGQMPAIVQTAEGAMPMGQADLTMWLWHGVAAFVTIAAIHQGERSVVQLRDVAFRLAAWVRRNLLRPVRSLRPAGRIPLRAALFLAPPALAGDLRVAPVGLRGPPRLRTP